MEETTAPVMGLATMSNPSKQKGTAFETAVVNYLRAAGHAAHRLVLTGSTDSGDIAVDAWTLEAKNRRAYDFGAAVDEAKAEAWQREIREAQSLAEVPQSQPLYAAVIKRNGKGDVARAFVVMELEQFADVLNAVTPFLDSER